MIDLVYQPPQHEQVSILHVLILYASCPLFNCIVCIDGEEGVIQFQDLSANHTIMLLKEIRFLSLSKLKLETLLSKNQQFL